MESLLQDVRFALRALRNNPGFTLVTVLTLGLGIGANTTIYTWLESIVLRPLPLVPDPDQLVLVKTRGPSGAKWSFSAPDFRDVAAAARSFSTVAATNMVQLSLRNDSQAERVWGMEVSAAYFDLLGVRPILGRGFRPSEDSVPGASTVAILGYSFWQRRFAGDSAIVGRSITLNGRPFTVIGIAPPRFGGTIVALAFDMWLPLSMHGVLSGDQALQQRGWRTFEVLGRLKPGVTVAQADAEMRAMGARMAEAYPDDDAGTTKEVIPFNDDGPQSWFKPALMAVLGVTAVVLLIACANVANLLLARGMTRRREMGIRLALGARRVELVRQLLCESVIISLLGGALGVMMALWGRDLLGALMPAAPYPVSLAIRLDANVILFALIVSVATVVLFGVVPSIQASRPDVISALKDAAGAGSVGRGRLRATLVVVQVALSLVALVSAGLFLRSLQASQAVALGVRDPAHVLLVSSDLHLAGYAPGAGRPFVRQLLERVGAVPGVVAVTVARNVPLGFGGRSSSAVVVDGYTPGRDEDMSIENNVVAPSYFETMGTPMLHGRGVAAQDDSGAAPVAVVNEAFARRYWPTTEAIGRRLKLGGIWRTVVGVAATAKYHQVSEPPLPFVFIPMAQAFDQRFTLHVRTMGAARVLAEPIRTVFASLDPNVPFLDVRTMTDQMGAAVFFQRLAAIMLGLFGTLALVMATMGIYSVVAYSVSQRTRELGIRTALGAGRREIVRLVLGEGMRLAMVGVVAGSLAAFGAGQLLKGQLFGVSPADPLTYGGIAAILGAVALLASWIPARRAARVDPMVALRYE